MFDELSRDELLEVLHAYDHYIQTANDENRYSDGWYPVCIGEFYDCDFQYFNDPEEDEPEI